MSGAGKPNLFIVGAPKCGTTAWVEYLRTHPEIFFPEIKEPHFFAKDLPGKRWTTSTAKYESLFERAGDARIRGEASVMYLYSDTAARAIRDYNPDARIIIFLRPQEQFLPSLHHQYLFGFSESVEDFETAWRMSGRRPSETIPAECADAKLLDYVAIARFGEQVERYFTHFPREQILVIRFDEWTADPRATYLKILEFLGVEDDCRTDFPPVNEAKAHRVKWLGRLITHPPRFARLAVAALRKLTGRHALGIADRASQLLAAPGYRTQISPELQAEIRRCYESDNAKLEALLKSRASRVAGGRAPDDA